MVDACYSWIFPAADFEKLRYARGWCEHRERASGGVIGAGRRRLADARAAREVDSRAQAVVQEKGQSMGGESSGASRLLLAALP